MSRILSFVFLFALISFLLISCSQDATGPTVYERIVIDSYPPPGAGDPETDLVLYNKDGDPLATAVHSLTEGARIDTHAEVVSLSSGTSYYIKVHNTDRDWFGYYAVRVLSLAVGETPPVVDVATNLEHPDPAEDDDNAPGNIPTDPVDISLGNSNWVSRYLGEYDPAPDYIDDDWLKLVLP